MAENRNINSMLADPFLVETMCLLKKCLDFRLQLICSIWVKVTHVNSPSDFYVRPTCIGDEYLRAVEKASLKDISLAIDSLVLYKNKKYGWIRGKVLFIDKISNTCVIFTMDYGNIDRDVSLNNKIYRLSDRSMEIPSLVFNCTVLECTTLTETWKSDAIEAFRRIVQNEPCNINNIGNYDPATIAVKFETPEVETMLHIFGLSSLHDIPETGNNNSLQIHRSRKRHYDYKILSVGDKLLIKFLGKDETIKERFYVAQIDDYKKHQEGIERFTNESKSFERLDVDEVSKGKPVCYRYDKIAYRARILNSSTENEKVKLQLMDTGRILNARLDSLYHLEEQYLQDAVVSMYCICNHAVSPLLMLRVGVEFIIIVERVGDTFNDPHHVVIDDVSENPKT